MDVLELLLRFSEVPGFPIISLLKTVWWELLKNTVLDHNISGTEKLIWYFC